MCSNISKVTKCKVESAQSAYILFLIVFIQICLSNCQLNANGNLSAKWFLPLTESSANDLVENFVKKATSINLLKQYYTDQNPPTEHLKPESILNKALNEVKKLFEAAESIVEDLAKKAGEVNLDSQLKQCDRLSSKDIRFYNKSNTTNDNETIFYYNSKCVCGHQLANPKDNCYTPPGKFLSSDYFNDAEVSTGFSAVHIPVDIYNEDRDVLADIKWTQSMEPFLVDKFCSSSIKSDIKWLYVATRSGVLRYFPARQWNVPCGEYDFFDTRSTSWFVQSMSSPKDVIIMIDVSGSIIGLTLDLIKLSVDHIMNSLTLNDFFNLVVFNQSASYLNTNCMDLLQASPINKQMALSWLDDIDVQGSSSFDVGFNFSFKILSNGAPEKYLRASCNPVILLLTDGGAEYPYKAFEKWNSKKQTRVFTYSVGKHFASTDSLKEMACNNRGHYMAIPSDSATHFQTMEYLVKLSKPLANSTKIANKWTLPYEDRLGLGTVMSVSRPIIGSNKRNSCEDKKVTNVTGVAGADILYSDISRIMDASRWGANAYLFGTENNGNLFYHPQLRKGRLDSPVTVDLADMEHMDVSELRRKMIDQETGSLVLNRIVLSRDQDHISETKYHYTFSSIEDSVFSVGLAIPSDNMHILTPPKMTNIDADNLDTANPQMFLEVYGYQCSTRPSTNTLCNSSVVVGHPSNISLTSRNHSLQNAITELKSCEEDSDAERKLNEIQFQASVSLKLANHWLSSSSHQLDTVKAVFVATNSKPSLLRIRHYGNEEYRKQIESSLDAPADKDYFLRALLSPSTAFFTLHKLKPALLSLQTFNNSRPESSAYTTTASWHFSSQDSTFIVASKAVVVSPQQAIPAVTGSVLSYEDVKAFLFNQTDANCDKQDCSTTHNCWNQDRICAVLDDGGLLLISNQDNHQQKIGKFFGTIDGDLMQSLEEDKLYESLEIGDHQVVCEVEQRTDNNASPRSLFIPSIVDILNTGWWMTSSSLMFLQNTFYFFSTLISTARCRYTSIPFNNQEFINPNSNSKKRHCVINKKIFKFALKSNVTDGQSKCNRSYMASRMPGSNLLLLIAEKEQDDCHNTSTPYSSEQLSRDATLDRPCPSKRYRKSPEQCYDARSYSANLDTECGAAQLAPPSFAIGLVGLLLSLCLR